MMSSPQFRRELVALSAGMAFGLLLTATEALVEVCRSEWAMHKLITYPAFIWDYVAVGSYLAMLLAGAVVVPLLRVRTMPLLSVASKGQMLWFAIAIPIALWIVFDAGRFLYTGQFTGQSTPIEVPIVASIITTIALSVVPVCRYAGLQGGKLIEAVAWIAVTPWMMLMSAVCVVFLLESIGIIR